MSMAGVNLIPRPRRQAAAARKRVRRWGWGVAGYLMLLLAGYAVCGAAMSVEGDDNTLQVEKTARQIDELNRTATTLKPQLTEAHAKLSVARAVGDQPDWSLLLAIISSTIDDDILLTSTKLDVATASEARPASRPSNSEKDSPLAPPSLMTISLHGMARSQAAVTQFALRLENLGLFERVDLGRSSRQTIGATEANVFRIECLLNRQMTSAKPTAKGAKQK
ncbi:hypothetical protein BH09PLA1_BH09PLA1_08040 [soil metagenome]